MIKFLAFRIVLLALVVASACTLVINDSARIELEGGNFAFLYTPSVNTPRPTNTPQIQSYITIRAGTNIRATASTSSRIVHYLSASKEARIFDTQGDWYRVSIRVSDITTIEGWVRRDRVIINSLITVTTTPRPTPTVIATPTQEIILRVDVPINGLQAFACMADLCAINNLFLSVYDDYRVVFMNENWAWICVLDSAKIDCIRQFYVKVN